MTLLLESVSHLHNIFGKFLKNRVKFILFIKIEFQVKKWGEQCEHCVNCGNYQKHEGWCEINLKCVREPSDSYGRCRGPGKNFTFFSLIPSGSIQ